MEVEFSPEKVSIPYILAFLAGASSSILGASVLIGWYTHNVTLLQLSTSFVPMQYNSALGFLLSGAGLLLVRSGYYKAGTACGIFVLLTGLLTIAEYTRGIDLGIDEFLMTHYITVQTSSPGRMAPNSALCFSLTGAALIVFGARANVWTSPAIAGTLGSLILGLGFVALTGYAIGLESAYGWGKLTRMAVHTAGGFMLLGVGIASLAWYRGVSNLSRLPYWFPALVGIGAVTVAISLWQALDSQLAQSQLTNNVDISKDLSLINNLLLAVSMMLATALSLTAHLAQSAKRREKEIGEVNCKLIAEMDERKQAEKELRKLARVVEQSPESIVITNLDAEIEYVNEAFLQATGYSRAEVLGKNPRMLQSGKTPAETYTTLWNALSQGQHWSGEFRNKSKDGREYIEFAIIAPIREPDGAVTHYLAIKEDITAQVQLNEELDNYRHHLEELVEKRTTQLNEVLEKAEAANQAKSAFLANMSHEIRTPMNAIVGLTYLMQQAGPTPEQAQQLDRIDASARHLLSIINDILDLAKIESGKLSLELSDFHLSAIFDHAQSLFREQIRSKGLTIEVDPDELPHWLKGDLTRLRQALLNYVGNAIKFTEQGTIFLRAKKLHEQGDEFLVRFEVQDTGIGIEPDKLNSLFVAFEQADVSTTRKYGGTGLGLVITRRLAQLMGGEAGATSEPGRGSTFWFTARLGRGHGILPTASSAGVVGARPKLSSRFQGSRILLAEDNAINREVGLALLGSLGLAVDTAENGREAVAKVRDNVYDLILMDIQMPEMDGLEATRIIRSMAGKKDLPILATTAAVFEEDYKACLEAGMNDFITKPIDIKTMSSTLAKWLPEQQTADTC